MTDTLTKLWSTPIWLGNHTFPLDPATVTGYMATAVGQPVTAISVPSDLLPGLDGIAPYFLRAVADAGGHDKAHAAEISLSIDLLSHGHSIGQAYGEGDWQGWAVLAAVGANADAASGTLSLHDPRSGSTAAGVPGTPWGRPLTIKPVAGITAVFPGWVRYSTTPVEQGHQILVLRAVLRNVTYGSPA